MENIKIKRLNELKYFESYIKMCQPLVEHVYHASIYFRFGEEQSCINTIHWDLLDRTTEEGEKLLLKAINAICNTNFEIEGYI
jgi:hypothetical protein